MFLYQVVGLNGGAQYYDTVEELLQNHKQVGVTTSTSVREELQGQPRLDGLYGAMYNGKSADGRHVIRYETPEAYDAYSR